MSMLAQQRPSRDARRDSSGPVPYDACSRGAEGSRKQKIPEALYGSVSVLCEIKSPLVTLSTFLRFLLSPAGKKRGKLNVRVVNWTATERFANVLPQMTSSDDAVTILLKKIRLFFRFFCSQRQTV